MLINLEKAKDILWSKMMQSSKHQEKYDDLFETLLDLESTNIKISEGIMSTTKAKNGIASFRVKNPSKEDISEARFAVEDQYLNEYPISVANFAKREMKTVTFNYEVDEDLFDPEYDEMDFYMVDYSFEFELADTEKQAELEHITFGRPLEKNRSQTSQKGEGPADGKPDIIAEMERISADVIISKRDDTYQIHFPEYGMAGDGLEDYDDTLKMAEYMLAETAMTMPQRLAKDLEDDEDYYSEESVPAPDADVDIDAKTEHIEVNLVEYREMTKKHGEKIYYDYETDEEMEKRASRPIVANKAESQGSGCMTALFGTISIVVILIYTFAG